MNKKQQLRLKDLDLKWRHALQLRRQKLKGSDRNKKLQLRLKDLDLKRRHALQLSQPKPKDRWRLANSKSGKSANADKTSAKKRNRNEAPAAQAHPVIRLMMRTVSNGSVQSARLQK